MAYGASRVRLPHEWPEVAFVCSDAQMPDDLLDDKAFPGCPNFAVSIEVGECRETQQRMKQARVSEVDLASFDLTLFSSSHAKVEVD